MLCSTDAGVSADSMPFVFLLLNTLKTGGMLATKLLKLKALPALLQEKHRLRDTAVRLAKRAAELELIPTGGATNDSDSAGPAHSAGSSSSYNRHARTRSRTHAVPECHASPRRRAHARTRPR
jgi:hypothetical protein